MDNYDENVAAPLNKVNLTSEQILSLNNSEEAQNLSLEAMTMLVQVRRIDQLEEKMKVKADEIKGRQNDVKKLHNILSKINSCTDKKGKLDLSKNQELAELLEEAKSLGVEVKLDKNKLSKEEKERLLDNIRVKADDLSSDNQLAMQDAQAYMNQRHETYEMTKSIMQSLHNDKMTKARKMVAF